MTGGQVQIVDLVKRFAEVTAVDGINLDVAGGEFFSLLGPSGCGKTTTLRLIAGFEQPTEGQILLDGRDVAQTPPHKRNVNTVFQSYALFPFLTVEENVSFGLRYQNVTKDEARKKTAEALALVRLEGFQKRRPSQLSGGQQQRVALARALVLNPAVLLLDEPLGALDAKLRKALQIELKALQEEVGITFIYVTHDQEEALTMSDRLAVMSNGRIEQIGSPVEVYEEPSTAYVADFLGVSNMMSALGDGAGRVRVGDFQLMAAGGDLGCPGTDQTCDPSRAGPPRGSWDLRRQPDPGHGRARALRGLHHPGSRSPRAWRDPAGVDAESRRRPALAAGNGRERSSAQRGDSGARRRDRRWPPGGGTGRLRLMASGRPGGLAGAAVKDQDTLGTGAS